MARHTKEYNDGYQAAIEAIKQQLNNQQNNSGGSGDSGQSLPDDMTSPQEVTGGGGNGEQSNKGNGSNKGGGSGSNSRTDKSNPNQGVVRPEDCQGPSSLGDIPSTPGGMMSKEEGDKICEEEGYEKEGGSDSAVEREWKDAALKEAQKMKGDQFGNLKSKLEGLYKVSTDWKKDLRQIVGHSISAEDKRQAYANKNILISQDRIARTDKDKYDNLDYMMAWIDSSGSMSDDQLRMCLSEVYAVALAKKPVKLVVIQCDTRIQEIKEYTNLKQLKTDMIHATVKGRGGTELKPCWDLLLNDPKYKRHAAELVMIFTDGYLNQYKRNPRTMSNLCWVIIDNPSFNLQYKDIKTKMVHINTSNIK